MASHYDYPATMEKLGNWVNELAHELTVRRQKYNEIKRAIVTGEGDPNGIMLTPGQVAELEAEVSVLEAEVLAVCSAHDVEPIELPEED